MGTARVKVLAKDQSEGSFKCCERHSAWHIQEVFSTPVLLPACWGQHRVYFTPFLNYPRKFGEDFQSVHHCATAQNLHHDTMPTKIGEIHTTILY